MNGFMDARPGVKIAVGLFVFTALLLFGGSLFMLGQRGGYFAARHRLNVFFSDVAGLRPGAPVRVAGVTAGRVGRIHLPTPPERRARVELEVSADALESLRGDSVARIGALGFMGDKVVEISVGSAGEVRLASGATIAAAESHDFGTLIGQGERVLGQAERLGASLERGEGALPWLVNDPESRRLLVEALGAVRAAGASTQRLAASLEPLVASLDRGQGALPWLLDDPESKQRIVETLDAVRGMVADVEQGKGAVSWLLRDPASRRAVEDLGRTAETLAALSREVKEGRGLAHALIYDPAGGRLLERAAQAVEGVRTTSGHLEEITGKIVRGEGTLGALVADPTLYEGLTTLLEGAERSRILRWAIRHALKAGRKALDERSDAAIQERPDGQPLPRAGR